MATLVGTLRTFGSITVNAVRIYQIHACVNLREFHVNLVEFLLKFGNVGHSREFGTNLEILVKFAGSARDIRTNFVRICRIRTNFVRMSYEIRTEFVRISQFQAQGYGNMMPRFFLGALWA